MKRGVVLTTDALFAVLFVSVIVSLLLVVLAQVTPPAAGSRLAGDALTVIEKKGWNASDARQMFFSTGSCGAIVVRNASGSVVDAVSACGCSGRASVSKRSLLREANGRAEELMLEAEFCARS